MIAKLDNFSENTKLPSVKSRIGDDIFSLFGKFRLSQTLSRLCMEKQCGYYFIKSAITIWVLIAP